jgi:hypothetical protein
MYAFFLGGGGHRGLVVTGIWYLKIKKYIYSTKFPKQIKNKLFQKQKYSLFFDLFSLLSKFVPSIQGGSHSLFRWWRMVVEIRGGGAVNDVHILDADGHPLPVVAVVPRVVRAAHILAFHNPAPVRRGGGPPPAAAAGASERRSLLGDGQHFFSAFAFFSGANCCWRRWFFG